MPDYKVESRTRDGIYLATLPYRDLQGEFRFNTTQEVRFSMNKIDIDSFTANEVEAGRTEIRVYRNDVLIFVGPLWNLTINSDQSVSLMAQDLSSYFLKRKVDVDTTIADTFGNVAWSLIQTSQAKTDGGLGITRGVAVPANAPSGTYKVTANKMINEILEEISAGDNGFDWYFSTDRKYNQYYPRLQRLSEARLEYGSTIKSYSVQHQGLYESNTVIAVGKDSLVSPPMIDATMRTKYGLREFVASNTSLTTQSSVNNLASATLDLRREINKQVQITTDSVNPFDLLQYGDLIRTIINDGYVQIDQNMRYVGFQLTVGKHGDESFTLYLNDLREL